jgi:hypothetical protein
VSIDQAIAEVRAAADRLGAVLSDHAVVLQRAGAAVRELDLRLEAAQSSGTMAFFNSEFRKRRLAAAKFPTGKLGDGCARYWHQLQRADPCRSSCRPCSMPRPSSEWRRPRRRTRLKAASSKLTRWAGKSPSLHRLQDAPRRGRGARTGDISRLIAGRSLRIATGIATGLVTMRWYLG